MCCFSGIVSLNTNWMNRDLAKADVIDQYVAIGINPNPIDRMFRTDVADFILSTLKLMSPGFASFVLMWLTSSPLINIQ